MKSFGDIGLTSFGRDRFRALFYYCTNIVKRYFAGRGDALHADGISVQSFKCFKGFAIVKRFTYILVCTLLLVTGIPFFAFAESSSEVSAASADTESYKLKNGSFETFASEFTTSYKQVAPKDSDYWKTTAEQGLMELLRANSSTYISGANVKPRDGLIAAELNADEESSLYQVVDTEPSSLYEWGVSHAARTASDTMAIIIGPNQDVAPSKNYGEGYETSDLSSANPTVRTGYKYGKDQMMQMVAWLKSKGVISNYDKAGIANGGQAIELYSKKFAARGAFRDNADNQPFSLTPSKVYTEKWCIWVITDHNNLDSDKNLIWGDYGANAAVASESLDLNEYYLYKVPSGQNKTLFAFTSIENKPTGSASIANPTYGNFLDGVNFKIYRALSGSTTLNGSAIVGSSDGTSSGEGATGGHLITADNGVTTYVEDGANLTIEAKIATADKNEVSFAGVYCTMQNPDGIGTVKQFISVTAEGWTRSEDSSGNIVYSRVMQGVTSAIDLHFVFVRSPRITYDANGGKAYDCGQTNKADSDDPANTYSFKPLTEDDGTVEYIQPYTSHAAEGQTPEWKFMGWKLFDNSQTYDNIIPAVHKVAYNQDNENTSNNAFLVIDGDGEFVSAGTSTWDTAAGTEKLYNKGAPGLSFIAQWRWRQTFIPKTDAGSGYKDSNAGGTVEVTSAGGDGDENYESAWTDAGGKAYYAESNETVTTRAEAAEGYYFNGWYDANGTLVTLSDTLTYVEAKEGISTYYAYFAKDYQQRFIRQIQVDGVWTDLADDDSSKVELLDHTILNDTLGAAVSSTASNNSRYGLVGWYNADGSKVDDSMLINSGKTIRYNVTGDVVYYARFEASRNVKFMVQFINADGTLTTAAAADKSYGKLSTYSEYGVTGDAVSSKAYPAKGYMLEGWYDGPDTDASAVDCLDATDAKIVTPQVTAADGVTYYARFKARDDTKYVVEHYFKNWSGTTNGTYKKVESNTYYGTTGATVTPVPTELTGTKEGYRCVTEIEPGTIAASGGTVFKLYYDKDEVSLLYEANPPDGLESTGEVASQSGYVGYDVTVGPGEKDTPFQVAGYIFNGWNTKADGTGTAYFPKDKYNLLAKENAGTDSESNPNVLYAQWAADTDVQYKVEHYKLIPGTDGSFTAPDKADVTETLYATTGETVKGTAKSFEGYEYAAGFSSNGIAAVESGSVAADGSLVLKLYYKPLEDKLTYKANGGAGADRIANGWMYQEMTVEDGSMFTREGYTFNGWKTPSGKAYAAGSKYTLTTEDDVLLAQWKANTNTEYKVYHYLVSADGTSAKPAPEGEGGVTSNPQILTGTTNSRATADSLQIDGYTYKSDFDTNGMKTVASGIIAGDGSLTLKLYYIPVPEQCAETMYYQKVWLDADGNPVDFNKTGAEGPSEDIAAARVETQLQVSADGGSTWTDQTDKYSADGTAQAAGSGATDIERGPNKVFADLSGSDSRLYWTKSIEGPEYNLPLYNEDGEPLIYRLIEKEGSLPDGWKQFTGNVSYTESGAEFINPITKEKTVLEYFRYDDSHKIDKKDYQQNVFIINYDSREPLDFVVSKIDGSNSDAQHKVPLAGAVFTLYEKSDRGTEQIVYKGTSAACTQVGSPVMTELNGDETKALAEFSKSLKRGKEYYLVETSAPAGYRLLAEPRKIVVSRDGTTALIDEIEKDIVSDTLEIELGNYLSLTMPTSGINITGRIFAAAGLLVMLAALLLLTRLRIRKRLC